MEDEVTTLNLRYEQVGDDMHFVVSLPGAVPAHGYLHFKGVPFRGYAQCNVEG